MNEENPFKKLEEEHPAPMALKERVMTSVEISKLLMEVTDLFTNQMGSAALGLFRINRKNPENDSPASSV